MSDLLPSGTITFLFTDIEGSTRLWETDPERMRPALARHDVLVADAIAAHGGHLFKHTGDGVCAAFASAPAALAAAIAAQRALEAEAWETVTLRARMALHTGEAAAVGADYQGPALNRAARLLAAGHGGQILLTQATATLLREDVPTDVSFCDLGAHRLRDLLQPEGIFQVAGPGLQAEFPPLRTLEAHPNNLPAQATSFVGREGELTAVGALLDGARLVTLTGAGGTGKTRLALQAAAMRLERYRDGVWLVELVALRDPAVVPQLIAQALHLTIPPDRTPQEALIAYLAEKDLLLLLDNCEHLLAGCAPLVATLLRVCPRLKVLATSRERLRVHGEALYPVPPLTLPGRAVTGESLTTYAAVRLFIDRALAVQPAFQVTNANAPALAQVCAMLEGIPLAIELAVARLRSLSLEGLAERLGDRFRLLTGGEHGNVPHHQTLRATIDWSHDLLSQPEQTLFRRLAVFAGGWSLDAAEEICAGDDLAAPEVFDLLDSLVEKSLAQAEPINDTVRYRMLETVRAYAAEKLDAAGETTTLRDRHYRWFLEQANRIHRNWWRYSPNVSGGAFTAIYLANYRAALAHGGKDATAQALAGSIGVTSPQEARACLSRLLAGDTGEPTDQLAHLYLGYAACSQTLVEQVRWYEEAAAIFRRIGDDFSLSRTLLMLGAHLAPLQEPERAQRCIDEAEILVRRLGNDRLLAELLQAKTAPLWMTADGERARPLLEEALACVRRVGDSPYHTSLLLSDLALANYLTGDLDAAIENAKEAIRLQCAAGKPTAMNAWRYLGDALRALGQRQEARLAYLASMDAAWAHATVPEAYETLVRFSALAAAEGNYAVAVRDTAAAEHLREADGFLLSRIITREIDPALAAARAALSPEDYQAAWEAGQALDLKTALATCRAEEEARAVRNPED